VVCAIGGLLVSRHSLKPYSDPAQWYRFGVDFSQRFSHEHLAYGFPLLLSGAAQLVGPLNAFLVNIPILMLMAVCFYRFARWHAKEVSPSLLGAVALLLFVWIDRSMLLYLVNPYRDPLSMVLLLSSCTLMFAYRERPEGRWWLISLSGICFGLSCSVRETNVLMLGPLFLYAVTERLLDRRLPFWRPLGIFAISLALAIIPYAIQNTLVGGNPVIPAQAAEFVSQGKSVVPGVRAQNLVRGLPRVVRYLIAHFGVVPCGFMVVGVVVSAWRRNRRALCVSLVGFVIYLLFYAGYKKTVARYLFVTDLFALPLMAVGLSALLSPLVGWATPRMSRWRIPVNPLVLIFVAAAAIAVVPPKDVKVMLRLSDVRLFRERLQRELQSSDIVIAERPLRGLLECFVDVEAEAFLFLGKKPHYKDPGIRSTMTNLVATCDRVFMMCYNKRLRDKVLRDYDLSGLQAIPVKDLGVSRLVPAKAVWLGQMVPWAKTNVIVSVKAPGPGAWIVRTDVGMHSKQDASFLQLRVNGQQLDNRLLDDCNYHAVMLPAGRACRVQLVSDKPVTGMPGVKLMPLDEPIQMCFRGLDMIYHRSRFSESFLHEPESHYPGIQREGAFLLPTPARTNAIFIMSTDVAMDSREKTDSLTCTIRAGGKEIASGRIEKSGRRASWFRLSGIVPSDVINGKSTPTAWTVSVPEKQRICPPALVVRQIVVSRIEPEPFPSVDMGKLKDDASVVQGFYDRESDAGGCAWRWTGPESVVRLIVGSSDAKRTVEVSVLGWSRPNDVPQPAPKFALDGTPCVAAVVASSGKEGGAKVVYRLTLSETLEEGVHTLRIRSTTWNPSKTGRGRDTRDLGLRVDRISVVPAGDLD
jgi:hypothetical protein